MLTNKNDDDEAAAQQSVMHDAAGSDTSRRDPEALRSPAVGDGRLHRDVGAASPSSLPKFRSARQRLVEGTAQSPLRLEGSELETADVLFVRPVIRSERNAFPSKASRDSSEIAPADGGLSRPTRRWCSFRKLEPGTASYQAYLAYLTLGVIYGDIGTSPLYTLSSVINGPPANPDTVLGGISLMIYTLLIVTVLKYVVFILQADDFGEGGTFALYSLLQRSLRSRISSDRLFANLNLVFSVIAIIGVSAILADGILTPAISVMGAIDGLKYTGSDGITQDVVVGASIAILVLFFIPQRFGTRHISSLFSPIIVVWYSLLFGIGAYNISRYPGILAAFNPAYMIRFLGGEYESFGGWQSIGAAFLTVTGSEALYADLGHFNKKAVRTGAMLIVVPSLIVCYLGQGAALVLDPTVHRNAFYLSLPSGLFYPMLVVSVLAAIVASQAMVTATFSIIAQAIRLQYFPRLLVKHTDQFEFGQVYIGEINAFLCVMVVAVVAGYRDVTALGFAYGVTVSLAFFLTTVLFSVVIVVHFKRHPVFGLVFFSIFGAVDANFLAANLTKFTKGGWFSVTICLLISSVLCVWRLGRYKMVLEQNKLKKPMETLFAPVEARDDTGTVTEILSVVNVPVPLIICFASSSQDVPAAFVHFVRRVPIRPANTVFVTINAVQVAFVAREINVQPVEGHQGVFRVVINHGYCETPPPASVIVAEIVRFTNCSQKDFFPPLSDMELMRFVDPTFIVGRDRVIAKEGSGVLHRFLVDFFQVLYFFSRPAGALLSVPVDNTLEVGVCVSI